MATPLILRLVASAISITERAGCLIRESLQKSSFEKKNSWQYEFEADRASNRCIFASLLESFPKIKVISEDGAPQDLWKRHSNWKYEEPDQTVLNQKCPRILSTLCEQDIIAWVDPLDGVPWNPETNEENITVMIGIAVGGKPVAGVIHQPFYKSLGGFETRTIWGIKGIGCGGFKPKPLKHGFGLTLVTKNVDLPEEEEQALKTLNPTRLIRSGGNGRNMLMILDGLAHAFVLPTYGCNKWDTCAPEAILRTIGGNLTDIFGNAYTYSRDSPHSNSGGVIATYHENIHYLSTATFKLQHLQNKEQTDHLNSLETEFTQ